MGLDKLGAKSGRRFGPSGSRVRFLASVAETVATTSLRNKSFWARPRLVGASLRCRRQVHGGGTPRMEPLYRSRSVAACHLCGATESPTWCSKGAEDAEARRMDQARVSYSGVHRCQRACFQGQRSLGRGPDQWAFNNGFNFYIYMSFYCGSPQSLCAMKLHLTSGSAAAARVGVSRRRSLESSVQGGFKDQFVISNFLEVIFACTVGQLSSVSFYGVLVFALVYFP
jgi:hypothetical protein